MNIIFWILVLVALVCVWFCLSGIFRAIGRFFSAIVQDTADALNESEDEKMRKTGLIGGIMLGVLLLFSLIAAVVCMEIIPAGYVGVVYSMNGGVQDDLLTQGFHIVSPTKKGEAVHNRQRAAYFDKG